jgi:hypothetical protein
VRGQEDGMTTKVAAACPHRRTGACGACFWGVVNAEAKATTQRDSLVRALEEIERATAFHTPSETVRIGQIARNALREVPRG